MFVTFFEIIALIYNKRDCVHAVFLLKRRDITKVSCLFYGIITLKPKIVGAFVFNWISCVVKTIYVTVVESL